MVVAMAPRITSDLAAVDAALERWARWSDNALPGWPRASLLGRVVEYGANGAAHAESIRVTEVSELAERVDHEIARLSEDQQAVIHKHYRAWERIEDSAKTLNMTPERFRTLLHRARRKLKEALDL